MFKTLSTLLRAHAAEAEEAIFDANATRLLEQRLREANAAFEAGKRDLALVLAEEAGERRLAEETGQHIATAEAEVLAALEQGADAQAERLAERIAGLTDEHGAHTAAATDCADSASRIRRSLEGNARLLAELRRGLATTRAAAAVNRANARCLSAAGVSQSAIEEARRTLERIRLRQTEHRDFAEAMDRVERDPALRLPGSEPPRHASQTDPKAVLERLRARRNTAGAPKP